MAKYISRAAIAAAALALGVSGAYAAVYGNGNLHVSVNVDPTCSITVGDITFTRITGGARTTEEIKPSSIGVSCNTGAWNLSINDSEEVRTMKNSTATLNYKLCNPTPTGYTAGCTPFNQNHPIAGNGLTDTTIIIYGVMEGDVLPTKPGIYSDTVQILVTN
jgi:spore coat protein U-like protein